MQQSTNHWLEADELQIPAIQGNERRKLPVLRRIRSCRERGLEPGARFPFTEAAFPHEVSRATPTTRNIVSVFAIDSNRLWMDFVTLCAFDLERFKM